MSTPSPSLTSPSPPAPLQKTAPIYKSGRWINPWPTWHQNSPLEVARMMLDSVRSASPQAGVDVDAALPVVTPDLTPPSADRVTYTWLGHGHLSGAPAWADRPHRPHLVAALRTDAVAGSEAAAAHALLDRAAAAGGRVLMSHNHYDHLDYDTCRALVKKGRQAEGGGGRVMRWYVGKGIEEWLVSNAGARREDLTGMVWWDETSHPPSSSSADASSSPSSSAPTIIAVPCQHFSVRTGFDSARTLWVGFIVRHAGYTMYYSGDTAYCAAFAEIGAAYGPIDFVFCP